MVLSKDIACIEAETFIDVDENAIKFLESDVKPETWSEDPFAFFNGNTSSYEAEDMMSDNFHWGIEWEYINEIPTLKSQQSIRCLNFKFY